jgi:hypothetical protein
MKAIALGGWLAVLVLGISSCDYHTELEQENARLNARVARMVEPPSLIHPICPTGNMIAQRIDKRNRKGEIVKSRWVSKCVVAS